MKPGESTKDVIQMIDVIIGDDEELRAKIEAARQRHALARQIWAAREEKGLSRNALALEIGTSPSAIARLEQGNGEALTVKTLRKLAQVLGLRLEINMRGA